MPVVTDFVAIQLLTIVDSNPRDPFTVPLVPAYIGLSIRAYRATPCSIMGPYEQFILQRVSVALMRQVLQQYVTVMFINREYRYRNMRQYCCL